MYLPASHAPAAAGSSSGNFGQIAVPGGFSSDFTFTFVQAGGQPTNESDLVVPFDFTFFLNDLDHGGRRDGQEAFQMFGYDTCLLAGDATSALTDPNNDNAASYDVCHLGMPAALVARAAVSASQILGRSLVDG